MQDAASQLKELQERNRRVELDKAWETSVTRRAFIAVITYLTALVFLWMMNVETFYLNALVPAGSYVLSTLSLPWMKQLWIGKRGSM